MKKTFIIILLLLSIIVPKAKAQKKSGEFMFTGIVVEENSKRSVALCHIYNENKRKGFIADTSGKFNAMVSIGDTLVFMALGYFGKLYTVKPADTAIQRIILTPQTYEIEPVIITVPRTYQGLKKAILSLETDGNRPMPELPVYNPFIRQQLLDTNVIYNPGFMIMHPVSGIYYRFSKEEKSKRMVSYLQEQQLKQPAVDAKFNRELVTKLTGLKDDDLTDFLGYCNFSFNYLYSSTPLEIVDAIYLKYDEFKKCCMNEKIPKESGTD